MSNLNAAGDMAFAANLSGSTSAVIRDSQGQLTMLARTGDRLSEASFLGCRNKTARGEVALVATVGGGGLGPYCYCSAATPSFRCSPSATHCR